MSSIRKSPSSKSRHSLVKSRIPTSSETGSHGRRMDCSDNSEISGGGGSPELGKEVPHLYVTSILKHELDSFDQLESDRSRDGHEIQSTTKPSWAEMYDRNNNLVPRSKISSSEARERVDIPDADTHCPTVSTESLKPAEMVNLTVSPTHTVFKVGGSTPEANPDGILKYEEMTCVSKIIPGLTFPSRKSQRSLSKGQPLTSQFMEWSIVPEDRTEASKSDSLPISQVPMGIPSPAIDLTKTDSEERAGVDSTKSPSPVLNYLPEDESEVSIRKRTESERWELSQETRSRLPHSISSQQTSISTFPHMRLQDEFRSNPDFITDFMRSIIPEDFEGDFISKVYNMGSKLLDAGLQLAASYIGDESDLEPREDVIQYGGYVIRTSGRGVLLQGLYINCNLHQAHPELEGMEAEATTRVRIVVSLGHAVNSVPSAGEFGSHSQRDPQVLVDEGRWTFTFGETGPSELEPVSFIDIQVPPGVTPESIRYSGLADGILIIEAP